MKRRDFLKHAGLLTLAPALVTPQKEGWIPEIPETVQCGCWWVKNNTELTLNFSKWPKTFEIQPGGWALIPSQHRSCHYNYGLEVVWIDSKATPENR